jgi:hypothetical protein
LQRLQGRRHTATVELVGTGDLVARVGSLAGLVAEMAEAVVAAH